MSNIPHRRLRPVARHARETVERNPFQIAALTCQEHERRSSPHTLSAYSLDLAHFLRFMSSHLGKPVSLADLDTLQRSDYRAWLASRQEHGLKASSTARALSVSHHPVGMGRHF